MDVVRAFKALGKEERFKILMFLARGPLGFMDLQRLLYGREKARLGKCVGTFAYHVKVLLKAGLIKKQDGLYHITDLGRKFVSFAEKLFMRDMEPRGPVETVPVETTNPRKKVLLTPYSNPPLLDVTFVEMSPDGSYPAKYYNALLTLSLIHI